MMATQASTLDGLLPDMVRYLNISNLTPHLKKAQLLTDDELERLEVNSSNTTRDAALKMLKFLKRKGPGIESAFLEVLKASMQFDAHLGHATIIEALERSLTAGVVASTSVQHPTGCLTMSEDCVSSDGMYGGGASSHPTAEYTPNHNPQPIATQREADIRDLSYRLKQSLKFRDPMDSRAALKLGDIEYMDDIKIRSQQDVDALKCKIVRDNSKITMTFARHVLGIYRVLSRLKVSISEIRVSLRFLGCLRNAPADGNMPLYSASSDIIKAEKLEDLFDCLHNYSSWYNYGLIKFVALEFGGAEGISLIDDYEDELRRYFENLIAYQCPQFTLDGGIPAGYDTLIVKIDRDFATYSAQDMALFQGTISSLLNLDPKVLLLTSIEQGCVRLSFAFPSAIAGYIVKEALTVKAALRENGVTLIVAAGKHIPIGKAEHSSPSPQAVVQLEPAHKSLTITDSNTSHISFVSELSSTCTKTNSSSNSSSNRSSTIDCTPLNCTEAEILSIYSGTHSDQNNQSLDSSHVGSPLDLTTLTHAENCSNKPTIARNYFSEFDLLANVEASPERREGTLRAFSMPNCEMVGIDELCTGGSCNKKSRFVKAKRMLLSPLKLLPKFLRPSKSDLAKPKIDSILEEEEGEGEGEVRTPNDTRKRFEILSLTEEPYHGRFHYYKTDISKPQGNARVKAAAAAAAIKISRDFQNSAAENRPKANIPTVVLSNSQERDTELSLDSTISYETEYLSNSITLERIHDHSGATPRLFPRRQSSLHSETTSGYNSPSGSLASNSVYQFVGVPSSPVPTALSMSPFICDTVLYEEDEEYDNDLKTDQGIGLEMYKARHSRKSSSASRRSRWLMSDYGSNGRVESPEGSIVSSQCTSGYYSNSQQSLNTRLGSSQDSFDDRHERFPPSRSNSLPKRDHCSIKVRQSTLTSPKSRSNSFH